MTEEDLWYCRHCGSTEGQYFDRTACPEPCGFGHERCMSCHLAATHCPWEEV